MNYFTKEELEDIAGALLENPSYDTLRELDIKYNGEEEEVFENEEEHSELPEENNEVDEVEEPVEQETPAPTVELPNYTMPNTMPSTTPLGGPMNIPPFGLENQNVEMPAQNINPVPPVTPTEPQVQASPVQAPVVPEAPKEEQTGFPEFKIHSPEALTNQFTMGQPNNNQPLGMPNNINPPLNNGFAPNPAPNNIMGTTDNFNLNINQSETTSGPQMANQPNPFANGGPQIINGMPPVNNQVNNNGQAYNPNMQTGPSMFGQIMQGNQ